MSDDFRLVARDLLSLCPKGGLRSTIYVGKVTPTKWISGGGLVVNRCAEGHWVIKMPIDAQTDLGDVADGVMFYALDITVDWTMPEGMSITGWFHPHLGVHIRPEGFELPKRVPYHGIELPKSYVSREPERDSKLTGFLHGKRFSVIIAPRG